MHGSWNLVRAFCWAVAVILFIIGAYSDANAQELIGWGLAFTAGGLLAGELPGLSKREPRN